MSLACGLNDEAIGMRTSVNLDRVDNLQVADGAAYSFLSHLLGVESSDSSLEQDSVATLFNANPSNFRNWTFRKQMSYATGNVAKSRIDHGGCPVREASFCP